jgi:anti-sigma-K factor RskA
MAVDHQLVAGTVAAYVLGACDDDERRRVRVHLEKCRDCRELAARLTQAAQVLPLGVELVAPPPHLRARVAAAVAAHDRVGTGAALDVRKRAFRFAWPRIPRPVLGTAAGAMVGIALASLVVWNWAPHPPPTQFALSGTGTMAGARGDVTALSDGGALVSLTGLPKLEPDQVYELWLLDASGRAVPAGVFRPGAGGAAKLKVQPALGAVRQVAVTAEAGPGGVQVPTRKPELAGSAP